MTGSLWTRYTFIRLSHSNLVSFSWIQHESCRATPKLYWYSAPLPHLCPVECLLAWEFQHYNRIIYPASLPFQKMVSNNLPGNSSPSVLQLRHVGLDQDGIDGLQEPHQPLSDHPSLLLTSHKAFPWSLERHHLNRRDWILWWEYLRLENVSDENIWDENISDENISDHLVLQFI